MQCCKLLGAVLPWCVSAARARCWGFVSRVHDSIACATQDPELTVWYGPDTYMGSNLAQLFLSLAQLPDEEVKLMHPGAHCILELCPS